MQWVERNGVFLLPSLILQTHIFFVAMVCWDFSAVLLDFHKGSLSHGWVSKTVFSRGSWTTAKKGWSQFMGHCKVHSQMPITWCTGRQASSQVLWHVMLDPTPPAKALSSVDECQIVVDGGIWVTDNLLILQFCWCHSELNFYRRMQSKIPEIGLG